MKRKERRYHIYCDESIKKGEHYSNFYGGALIEIKDFKLITDVLHDKRKLILKTNELKWQKINAFNHEECIDAVDMFFDFVQSGRIKIRIFFRPNRVKPTHLSHEQKNNE